MFEYKTRVLLKLVPVKMYSFHFRNQKTQIVQGLTVHVQGSVHESVEEEHVLVKKRISIAPQLVNAADRSVRIG